MTEKTVKRRKPMAWDDIHLMILSMNPGERWCVHYQISASPREAIFLKMMAEDGQIKLDPIQMNLIDRIIVSFDWGGTRNRTIEFEVCPNFDYTRFKNLCQLRVDHLIII